MPGRRIGSVFGQSAFSDGRYIIGANGARYRPWEDILYDYFMLKFSSHFVDKFANYSTVNREYNNSFGNHHVFCYLVRSSGKHKHNTQVDYLETYGFELYSNYRSTGGQATIEDAIDFMVDEIQRIFMRYISHSIAGIDIIDNMEIYNIEPPLSDKNPFQSVFKRLVTINVQWSEQWLYPLTEDWEINHYGSRYYAGQFKELVEDTTYS